MVQSAGHDVIQNAHAFEKRNILEGPRDALAGDFKGFHFRPAGAFVPDLPFLGMVKARNNIEHRGFPSAIGSDNRANFSLAHIKGNILDRHHPAKPQGDILHFHHHRTNGAAICGYKTFSLVKHGADTPKNIE